MDAGEALLASDVEPGRAWRSGGDHDCVKPVVPQLLEVVDPRPGDDFDPRSVTLATSRSTISAGRR